MPERDAFEAVSVEAPSGSVDARWYPAPGARAAALLFGGIGGGFDTPARGLYVRLARHLPQDGIAALRVRFRVPGDLDGCVADVLAALGWAAGRGIARFGLVGHSFGGAVAITAAARRRDAAAVVTLSTQSFGTDGAAALRRRAPLLLVHGDADEVLPPICSVEVFRRAGEGARLELLPGVGHVLDEAPDDVYRLCHDWLVDHLAPAVDPR